MRVLAVIPARAGSKRVPGKNTKILGSKPLIAWTIDQALRSRCDHTMVSTDSGAIGELAQSYGADVPFLRSSDLAADDSNVVDALIEVVQQYKSRGIAFDSIALLQPTSPFRRVSTINRAIELHLENRGNSVVSVSPSRSHTLWTKRINQDALLPYYGESQGVDTRSQDLPPAYDLNGLIYVCSVSQLVENRSLYSEPTLPLIVKSEKEAIDIDTPFDWRIAELVAMGDADSNSDGA